jgi:hypothetical protein
MTADLRRPPYLYKRRLGLKPSPSIGSIGEGMGAGVGRREEMITITPTRPHQGGGNAQAKIWRHGTMQKP